jgi:non-homologous end joining protein Ku
LTEYELALRKLVKRKAASKEIEQSEPAEDGGKVIDLMEALRRRVYDDCGRKTSVGGKRKNPVRSRKAT